MTSGSEMGCLNKFLTCCCCCGWSCEVGSCMNIWHSYEACGTSSIECGNCCWTICAPICHRLEVGNFSEGISHCVNCLKYCLYGCALYCCAPCDGCITCIFYVKDIWTQGVSGHHDIVKHTETIGSKIRDAMGFPDVPQPRGKFL